MSSFLTEEFIRVTDEPLSWKEAISKAAEPLLIKSYITQDYIDSMVKNVEEMGNYIVLAPKVAVPHARPEQGAKKVGFSLLVSKEPVDFNIDLKQDDDNLVHLIFVLSAIDNTSHITTLKQLSDIIDSDEKIREILRMTDVKEIEEKIKKFVGEVE